MLQIWAYFDKSRLHLLIHNALLIDMIPPNTSNSTGFTKSALVGSAGPLISFAQLFGSEARHRTSSTKPFHATRLRLDKNELLCFACSRSRFYSKDSRKATVLTIPSLHWGVWACCDGSN